MLNRSGYVTQADVPHDNLYLLVPSIMLGGIGIDCCRYCHTTIEISNSANIPSTKICMNCHFTDMGDESYSRACS
jgi:hypothetical protein